LTLTVFTGGVRSGKSAAAVSAAVVSDAPVTFIATAEPGDDEMVKRISRHRAERPADWVTVEAPYDLISAVAGVDPAVTVVIDCLAVWASNRMLARQAASQSLADQASTGQVSVGQTSTDQVAAEIVADAAGLAQSLAARRGLSVIVTNEVGSGIVPATSLGREFRDLLGAVNQAVVKAADSAYLVVAGRLLALVDSVESLSQTMTEIVAEAHSEEVQQ